MFYLFRARRAARWFWRRHRTLILPLTRVTIPILIALTTLMFRVSPMAACVMALLNTVFISWTLYLQIRRSRALNNWRPWVP